MRRIGPDDIVLECSACRRTLMVNGRIKCRCEHHESVTQVHLREVELKAHRPVGDWRRKKLLDRNTSGVVS
jgi:hypothetical protein